MKIRWTPTARSTYFKILEYLSKDWTIKEVATFVYETEHTIAQIAENSLMFKASKKKKGIRKGFITEYNSIYYRIKPRKKEIELLTFWDNRQNPLKSKY